MATWTRAEQFIIFLVVQIPQAADEEADDGNLDACALCGLGGNLLCCDGCPAAYHMRCIGEGAKSIPDGEWLCAECSLGGRGVPLARLLRCCFVMWLL